jgi:CubicO group peptidase (beta-lactamase class C family)
MSFPLGAYGMYSTVEDLYRWCQALVGNSLIDKELQNQMFTSINGYGFGWFIEDGAHKEVSHFGDINGFVNHLVVYPDEELVVIVLSNINITPVTQISSDLINIVFGKKVEGFQPFKPVGLESENLVGTYLNGEETLSIHFDKELYAVVPKMYGVPYKFKLVPIEANQEKVICKSNFIHDTYTFRLIEKGIPQSVELIDSYGVKKVYVKST